MKKKSNLKLFIATVLGVVFSFSYSLAMPVQNGNNSLAFNFSIFNFGDKEVKTENLSSTTSSTTSSATSETEEDSFLDGLMSDKAKEKPILETSCEYFDKTVLDVLSLEEASGNAQLRIEKVEETLDTEVSLRENIFVNSKDFLTLQKKEKVIFREMRKDISQAKAFYQNVDEKIFETQTFLEDGLCEDSELASVKEVSDNAETLVLEEAMYRKQFAASLKEKLKILQDNLKKAKK
jgi:hypothetical protein